MELDESLIQAVIDHADIVQIISSYLDVQKKGRSYVAICPFHNDSNPSLSISPERKLFKCFVCGTGGSAIRFVQLYEHISFYEALKKVAKMSDFHDPRLEDIKVTKKAVDPKKEPILRCLHDLTVYYQYSLNTDEGKDGLDYFNKRNLDEGMRKKYLLGYAFKDGQSTIKFLQDRGNSIKTIEDTGIASFNGSTHNDMNRGRAIFPICDPDGNVVGFSARRIRESDSDSKYVNTPETYCFTKGKILYNYHIAKQTAHLKGFVYVCEGFMDVFALSKIGIDNAVALMGTALTSDHINMLRALNCEIRLCLDGDVAGQTAMMKISKEFEKASLNYRIVDNQGSSKDPDEIINSEGENALNAYLNNLIGRVDFALNYYRNTNPLKTNEQKKLLIREFIPILLDVKSQLDLDNYLRRLAQATGYEVESIRQLVEQAKINHSYDNPEKLMEQFHPERKLLKKLQLAERELLYQMLTNKDAVDFYQNKEIGFYDDTYRKVANYIIDYAKTHDNFDGAGFITTLESSDVAGLDDIIQEATDLYMEKTHPNICSEALLENLLDSINKEKQKIYEKDTLSQSLEGKDPLEQARILAEFNRRKMKGRR